MALVEHKTDDGRSRVGVSFPEYVCDVERKQFQLGCKLRLFASSQEILEQLNIRKYCSRLLDYVHITQIRDVPEGVEEYSCFRRSQPKSSNERLARRKAKYKNISFDQAMCLYEGRKETYSRVPYIRLKSLSSKEKFRLMIRKNSINDHTRDEGFTTYGLSSMEKETPVPMF